MAESPAFDRDFEPHYGQAVPLGPSIRRVTAKNPGAFTFLGTNTYIVGRGRVAIVDPGPADAAHLEAVLAALAGETPTHIVLTHTHHDHVGNLAALAAATGADIVGCAPDAGSGNDEAGGSSSEYRPDRVLAAGERIAGPGWTLEAVPTPGHAPTHLAFAFPEESALFSGDHVMAWSTSVVIPPQGSMRAYRRSLADLLDRSEGIYFPGHGPPVRDPQTFLRQLIAHRDAREAAILERLAAAPQRIPDIVAALYPGLDPRLVRGAGMSVLAHLVELEDRGTVVAGPAEDRLSALFRMA
jgi:glyoxylase-like metal-dependent hydrolase (beta-lactamase superfamily II)